MGCVLIFYSRGTWPTSSSVSSWELSSLWSRTDANTSSFPNHLSFNCRLCWTKYFATLLSICDQKVKLIPCLLLIVGTIEIILESKHCTSLCLHHGQYDSMISMKIKLCFWTLWSSFFCSPIYFYRLVPKRLVWAKQNSKMDKDWSAVERSFNFSVISVERSNFIQQQTICTILILVHYILRLIFSITLHPIKKLNLCNCCITDHKFLFYFCYTRI